MAIISVVGNLDKRIIAIPLARGLMIDGKTAIITDDTSYKRLYKGSGNLGNISGLDIVIDYDLNEKSVEKLAETYESYKHYVYVSDSFIHPESNVTILCRGKDRSLISDDVAQKLGEYDAEDNLTVNSKEIILTTGRIDKKEMSNSLQMVAKYYLYLATIEETKTLDAPNDVVLAK